MANLFISYINLSPELRNPFSSTTHGVLVDKFNERFATWEGFFRAYEGYDLAFIIVTDEGVGKLEVKGPTVFRKTKTVDFSIFLPENIDTLVPENPQDFRIYLDWVFSGISSAIVRYGVSQEDIEIIKDECLLELGSGEVVQ